MSPGDISSGTSALTDALKQVFYIHKDVVSELKLKLDSLKKENDDLKLELEKKQQSALSNFCTSCQHLKQLNKTLKENFHSCLRDKNAIIKHLERRIKRQPDLVDTQFDTQGLPCDLEETSHHAAKGVETGDQDNISVSDEGHLAACQDNSSLVGNRSPRLSSRLRLPKDGQKRKRYVAEESGDCKRQKSSVSLSFRKDCVLAYEELQELMEQNDPLNDGRDSSPRRHHQEPPDGIFLPRILVSETENVNVSCLNGKGEGGSWSHQVGATNEENEVPSLNILVIPETLGMDSLSGAEEEDMGDSFSSTVKEVEQSQSTGCEDYDSQVFARSLVSKSDIAEKRLVSDFTGSQKLGCEKDGSKTKDQEDEMLKTADNSVDLSRDVTSMDGDDNMSSSSKPSPLSQGIFEASPGSPSQRVSTRPSRTGRQYMDTSNLVYHSTDRGSRLLRQTTLSQTFASTAKMGKRKNVAKDARKKSYEDDEEAAVQEAIRRSLSCKGENELEATEKPSSGRSPFKMPLSLTSPRRSPRKRTNYSNDSGEKENVDEQYKPSSSPVHFENDFAASSPKRSEKEKEKPSQELRRSPRLSSHKASHAVSPKGDVARKALFLDSRNLSSNRSPLKTCGGEQVSLKTSPRTLKLRKGLKTMGSSVETIGSSFTKSMSKGDNPVVWDDMIGENGAAEDGMNASLDPDMRLSMYLHSQNTAPPVTQVPWKKTGNIPLPSPPEHKASVCVDIDDTVAPNLLSLSMLERLETVADKTGSTGAIEHKHETNGRGKQANQTSWSQEDSDSQKRFDNDDDEEEEENLLHGDGDVNDNDDVDLSGDHGEETIAPSPQQTSINSMKVFSQSLPCTGLPSTSRSFKFVKPTRDSQLEVSKAKTSRRKGKSPVEEGVKEGADTSVPDVDGVDEGVKYPLREDTVDASLCDSFDVVPRKRVAGGAGQQVAVEFPHEQVVRKRHERDKLPGFSCQQCADYYKDMNLSTQELRARMRYCSRHKAKFKAPSTPEHFWSLSIRDTADEPQQQQEEAGARMETPRLPRQPRRPERKF